MFSNQTPTFMQNVINTELEKFHKINNISSLSENSTNDFIEGNVLFKIPINKSFINDLIDNNRNTIDFTKCLESDIRHETAEYLFNHVTDQIININANANFKDCMQTIMTYKNLLNENFYGAILRDVKNKDIILNPFHILTALSIMNDNNYMDRNYNIIIYAYEDRNKINIYTQTKIASTEKINNNIDALMKLYVNKIPTIIKITQSSNAKLTDEIIEIETQVKKLKDEDPDARHYIVAHQLLTKGVLAPYYGTSLIKIQNDNEVRGFKLTPFGSCNIAKGNRIEPSYNSVCTGSLANQTLNGLRSLSHVNLNSPYDYTYLQNGALAYADIMIERTIEIYTLAKIIKPSIIKLTDTFSDEELKITSLRDYRIWYKEQFPEALILEIKTRWDLIKLQQLKIKKLAMNTKINNKVSSPQLKQHPIPTIEDILNDDFFNLNSQTIIEGNQNANSNNETNSN